jgi:hypothetical protein
MDEEMAVEFLNNEKKRAFMTDLEVDLTNLVLKYKRIISEIIEYVDKTEMGEGYKDGIKRIVSYDEEK